MSDARLRHPNILTREEIRVHFNTVMGVRIFAAWSFLR
jgi:hypothetical protein